MALVASIYHLPPRVLPAIQSVEGGFAGSVSHNANGTDDFGIMQVNTVWLKPLARYTRLPEPAIRARLIAEPCFNIAAAGAIMRTYLDEARGDLMLAVSYYHSHTPATGEAYRLKVVQSAARMFEQARVAHP